MTNSCVILVGDLRRAILVKTGLANAAKLLAWRIDNPSNDVVKLARTTCILYDNGCTVEDILDKNKIVEKIPFMHIKKDNSVSVFNVNTSGTFSESKYSSLTALIMALNNPVKAGDLVRFTYAAGTHPGSKRLVKVESITSSGFGGTDMVLNEYRNFNLVNCKDIQKVTV